MAHEKTPKTTHHIHLNRGERVEVFYIGHHHPMSVRRHYPMSVGRNGPIPDTGADVLPASQAGSRSTNTQAPSRDLTGRRPPAIDPPSVDNENLSHCFYCGGDLVYPLDWVASGPAHWRILLRCPECEATREGAFDIVRVERLDDELDRAAASILGDLRQLTAANMRDELEVFVRALAADLIDPQDFLR